MLQSDKDLESCKEVTLNHTETTIDFILAIPSVRLNFVSHFSFCPLSAFLAADTAAIEPQGSVVAVGAVLPQVDLSIILPIGKDFSIARAMEESEERCKVFFI